MSNLIEKKCKYCGRSVIVEPDEEPICGKCNVNPDKKEIEEYSEEIIEIAEGYLTRGQMNRDSELYEEFEGRITELLHKLLKQH